MEAQSRVSLGTGEGSAVLLESPCDSRREGEMASATVFLTRAG